MALKTLKAINTQIGSISQLVIG